MAEKPLPHQARGEWLNCLSYFSIGSCHAACSRVKSFEVVKSAGWSAIRALSFINNRVSAPTEVAK